MTIRDFPFESASLGERRTVTVFLPPGYRSKTKYPAVFCADGQTLHLFARRLVDAMERERVPPVVLIGVHSSEPYRAQEYIHGADSRRFDAHERFFTDEIFRWAIATWNLSPLRQSCGVFGFSNGGAFALSMGARHRDQYGVVIAFSIAGGPERVDPSQYELRPIARYYLSAGTKEIPFLRTTRAVAQRLERYQIEHVHTERCATHDMDYWVSEFPEAIRWSYQKKRRGWLDWARMCRFPGAQRVPTEDSPGATDR